MPTIVGVQILDRAKKTRSRFSPRACIPKKEVHEKERSTHPPHAWGLKPPVGRGGGAVV
jgi:hypothetical protein